MERFTECPVCLESFAPNSRVPKILSCGHSLCVECLTRIFDSSGLSNVCPQCRKPFNYPTCESVPDNYALSQLLEALEIAGFSVDTEEKDTVPPDRADRVGAAASVGVGAAATTILVSKGVALLGFGRTGIQAGSAAAAWMASAAAANGGKIASGSLVSTLQSVGTSGLGTYGIPVAIVGGALGLLAYNSSSLFRRALPQKECVDSMPESMSESDEDEAVDQQHPSTNV